MRALTILLLLFIGACASFSSPLNPSGVLLRADLYSRSLVFQEDDLSAVVGSTRSKELAKLSTWALHYGYTLHIVDFGQSTKIGSIYNKHIYLDSNLTPDGQLNVLLHELAHDLIPFEGTRDEREAVAEIVAYMVADRIHWNTPESLEYIYFLNTQAANSMSLRYSNDILATVDFLANIIR